MSKKVLFLAPTGLDIYKDVICALEEAQYQVDFVSSSIVPNNPFKPYSLVETSEEKVRAFLEEVTRFWKEKLETAQYHKDYDFFFTIDGLMVCDYLFEELRKRNKNILFKLYLYDKIDYACKVKRFFKYYNDIFSFDFGDCEQYGLKHLPIYWVPSPTSNIKKFDIFGMASYSSHKNDRAPLFRQIRSISKDLHLKSYIKLYTPIDNPLIFFIKNIIKKLIKHPTYIPFSDIYSGLVTNKSFAPDLFREFIYSSDVVLDTHVFYQDGLTARFMWALGAEKKIITTNKAITRYPFYNKNQFYILEQNKDEEESELRHFLQNTFVMPEDERIIIKDYRIDNWLKSILNCI